MCGIKLIQILAVKLVKLHQSDWKSLTKLNKEATHCSNANSSPGNYLNSQAWHYDLECNYAIYKYAICSICVPGEPILRALNHILQ